MKYAIRQMGAIGRVAALEGIRQPVCVILAGGGCLAIALLPLLIANQLGEPGRLVRDGAQSFHFITGLLLGALLACSVFRNEANRGTAGAILCKPVDRSVFFLAKFCGIAAVVLACSWCMTCASLLASAATATPFTVAWLPEGALLFALFGALLGGGWMNYRKKKSFSSSFLCLLVVLLTLALVAVYAEATIARRVWRWSLLSSSALITGATLLFVGLAFCVAPVCKAPATVAFCLGVFVLGLFADYFAAQPDTSGWLRMAFRAVPNWQLFWMTDALSDGGSIHPAYLLTALLYGMLYLAGLLSMGLYLFEKKEINT